MFKRIKWFGVGVAAGVGGTVWAHRKVREQMDKARPRQLVSTATGVAGRVGDVVRDAVAEGRAGARERENELRSRIEPSQSPPLRGPSPPLRAVGGRAEGTSATPRGGPPGRR
ncbi:MAG TPA: hypothetical protein VJM33_07985 [Microthrixaceae bacterium]|nr:hypothetical protein [Microthrixaceae bacterium]